MPSRAAPAVFQSAGSLIDQGKTGEDSQKIKGQQHQIHPDGRCAMPFHRGDRTFNHMLSNPDPEKFAVRANKGQNSPKADQHQHQQESADEFETCAKVFLTMKSLRDCNR